MQNATTTTPASSSNASFVRPGTRWTTRGSRPRKALIVEVRACGLVRVMDETSGEQWLERAEVIAPAVGQGWTRRTSTAARNFALATLILQNPELTAEVSL